MNANVDLIVSAIDVFAALKLSASGRSQDYNVINTLQELDECFSHHFAKCAAAERFVASSDLFDKLSKAALALEAAKVSKMYYFDFLMLFYDSINSSSSSYDLLLSCISHLMFQFLEDTYGCYVGVIL